MTPPAGRLAEIAAKDVRPPGAYRLVTRGPCPGRAEAIEPWVAITAEQRDWIVAELALVTAERDKYRLTAEFLTELVNAMCEKARAAP